MDLLYSRQMSGDSVPEDWKGGMNVTYTFGGSFKTPGWYWISLFYRSTMYFDANLIRRHFCLRLVLALMLVSCYVTQCLHLSIVGNFPVTNHAEKNILR